LAWGGAAGALYGAEAGCALSTGASGTAPAGAPNSLNTSRNTNLNQLISSSNITLKFVNLMLLLFVAVNDLSSSNQMQIMIQTSQMHSNQFDHFLIS
jgi:hypothetical protein